MKSKNSFGKGGKPSSNPRHQGDRTRNKASEFGSRADLGRDKSPSRRPPTRQGVGNGTKPEGFKKKRGSDVDHSPRVRIGLYGSHAVLAALLNPTRTIHHIYATEQSEFEVVDMVEAAMATGLKLPAVTLLDKDAFDRALPKGTVHQGIGIDCDPLADVYLPDIINRAAQKDKSVVVMLDQVTDPHNLGAVIRSACAFGADAIIVQSRYAPPLNGLVAKVASGAMEHISVVYETNLARTIEAMQESGYFALALDERGEKTIGQAQKYNKTLLVLGAEGPGLRPLVRDKCDVLVQLPTFGALSSLNVSNAAAVSLYAVTTG
ncbi:MAG: 23S rRNA (guanosine(2251)-2'-O)-methyltransferase RlmB [Alphaproteobacteria bacterium]|jgi:23S rRNA (guanosine2251-2'-O)-methyltransferase|nr:23S rRNA (guanosine(2251)-2'-O)-methyltransferase RlmB [Alphaproteobacteria bacterium]MCB1550879.1 23S rRNA (guanosine(2251)-2'-O)-methyltransferase RlmB [Alphaproteobacteria bacterium]MCB9985612.1 23S rRNA (guanosine(2251)-2'-O)-methyltransferase RlmB [Micavibrio sp.]